MGEVTRFPGRSIAEVVVMAGAGDALIESLTTAQPIALNDADGFWTRPDGTDIRDVFDLRDLG